MAGTEGQLARAGFSLGVSGGGSDSQILAPDDFSTVDGSTVDATGAVIIRAFYTNGDVEVYRRGDPDSDGTYEISARMLDTNASGQHIFTDLTLIVTETAGIEFVNLGAGTKHVYVVAEVYPVGNIFVEQDETVTASAELARQTASRNTEETVIEFAHEGDADAYVRADYDDDSTNETGGVFMEVNGEGVVRSLFIPFVDQNATNPECEFALENTSGSTNGYMILGTVGGQP